MTNATTLVLLDAGLGSATGHHFSTAELLLKKLTANQSLVNISVLGNIGEWRMQLEKTYSEVNLIEHFRCNFYQYHNAMVPLDSLTPYINTLSSEYKTAIAHYLDTSHNSLVFFCHTLDWEHLLALSIAIHQLQQIEPTRIIYCLACLMFSPGCDYRGEILDKRKLVLSKIALRTAAQLAGLSLFASHYELKQAIDTLVPPVARPIDIHPCLIADWQSEAQDELAGSNSQEFKVLLYSGDAKETKGFHLLPQLLKAHLKDLRSDVQLVIQYTQAQKISSVLQKAITELAELAAKDQRIIIYNQFLSEPLLINLLKASNLFLFNYSLNHYSNMSSGFVWHLAWHKIPMVTFGSSWLTREASRLGVETHIIEQENFSHFINKLTVKPGMQNRPTLLSTEANTYYKTLFSSPVDWIYQECRKAI